MIENSILKLHNLIKNKLAPIYYKCKSIKPLWGDLEICPMASRFCKSQMGITEIGNIGKVLLTLEISLEKCPC